MSSFSKPRKVLTRAQSLKARSKRMGAMVATVKGRPAVMEPSAGMGLALPKGPAAKPGKGAPTVQEQKWLDAITAFGCVACWFDGSYLWGRRQPAVHHILRGSVRMGHLYSLPLCDPGHHQNGQNFVVSRHPHKPRFEARYGSEWSLVLRLCGELGFTPPPAP